MSLTLLAGAAALVVGILSPGCGRDGPAATLLTTRPLVFPLPPGPLEKLEPRWATFRVDVSLDRPFAPGASILLTQGHLLESGDRLADDEVRYRWPDPQWTDPAAENYLSLATSDIPAARLEWAARGREGRSLRIRLPDGAPADGLLHLTFGDQAGGSPGLRIVPFPLETELIVGADPEANGQVRFSPQTLTLRCVGMRPERLTIQVPSTIHSPLVPVLIRVDQGVDDGHHQQAPCESFEGEVLLQGEDGSPVEPSSVRFGPTERGVRRVELRLTNPSCRRLRARVPEFDLEAASNPFLEARPDALSLYWGSLQNHSAVGGHGAGTPEQAYRTARDVAGLDFFALTEHAGARAFHWLRLRARAESATIRGRFVCFPAYEWSHPEAGHRHVILRSADRPSFAPSGADEEGELDAVDLAAFAAGPGSDPDAIVIAHHTARRIAPTVDRFLWGDPAPPRQILAEIYSWHGFFDTPRPAWPVDGRPDKTLPSGMGSFLDEALAAGRFLGICAAGDGHLARPGMDIGVLRPAGGRRLVRHGLTGIWAPALDRDALFAALEERRCYATTGARILISIACATAPMGGEARTRHPPTFEIEVYGTARLDEVVLLRDGVTEAAVAHPDSRDWQATLTDPGAPRERPSLYHLHVLQEDGHEAWTSPIRVTARR